MTDAAPSPIVQRARALWPEHAVIIIAIAACAMIVVAFTCLIVYAGLTTKQVVQERSAQQVQRAVDRKLGHILQDISSATIWNDAYEKVLARNDSAWIDLNLGRYYHDYMKHDVTVVFDPQDRAFYAATEGASRPPEQLTAFTQAVSPLLRRVRADELAKLHTFPAGVGFESAAAAGGSVEVDGRVYLVQAMTVVPEAGYKGPLVARNAIVVSGVEVTPTFVKSIEADYDLKRAHLAAATPRGEVSAAFKDLEGEPVAVIAWTPDRPGLGALQRAKWTILAAALLIVTLLAYLIGAMNRLVIDLRQAREDAFAASRAKSEFLANISHEIRTPLNGVLGMAQVMSADTLTDEQRERLAIIRDSGSTLLALLNDVLDLSKIQAGKLEIEVGAFNLDELCRVVCGTFEGLAAAKDVQLGFALETGGQLHWQGDSLRLRQVLSNLISNAVKFTQHGSVRLRVRSTLGGVAFSVTDTGVGLNEAQLSRLFQKFTQGDASTTRRHGGSGLGLAICHDLVHLMGGVLLAKSRPDEGSEFTFVLPLTRVRDETVVAAVTAAPTQRRPSSALRVLAAEDNPTNQLVLRALLQPLELDLKIVSSGAEAVMAFQKAAFDIVLMDIQMPGMSGVEATRAMREWEMQSGRPRTPIVALSANVMTHHVEEYEAAGMDAHVAKPIEIEKLYRLLEKVVAGLPLDFQRAA